MKARQRVCPLTEVKLPTATSLVLSGETPNRHTSVAPAVEEVVPAMDRLM